MKLKFIFLFLILLFPVAAASGFSPTNLVYLLEPNQELCQIVRLDSTSRSITVFDVWAESNDVEWNVSLFNTTAEEHNLIINYSKELSINEREVEICISGSELGEYHGAVIFRQGQEGNLIMQLAVWLKILVEEPPVQPAETTTPGGNGGGGGGGGGGGRISLSILNNTANQTTTNETSSGNVELLSTQSTEQTSTEQQTPGENLQSTEEKPKLFTPLRVIPLLFIAGLVVASIAVRRKRKRDFG